MPRCADGGLQDADGFFIKLAQPSVVNGFVLRGAAQACEPRRSLVLSVTSKTRPVLP
jgi:hypothetical protein